MNSTVLKLYFYKVTNALFIIFIFKSYLYLFPPQPYLIYSPPLLYPHLLLCKHLYLLQNLILIIHVPIVTKALRADSRPDIKSSSTGIITTIREVACRPTQHPPI